MFMSKDGKMRIIQPKSFTEATKGDQNQTLALLMTGEFIMVSVAMPRHTKEYISD